MTELYEDMMTSLENAYCQMRTAGLGYATHALEAQMEDFRERIGSMKGMVEYTRADGKVDGGRIVKLVEVESRTEPNIEERPDEVVVFLDQMGHYSPDDVKRYVIAIAEVD